VGDLTWKVVTKPKAFHKGSYGSAVLEDPAGTLLMVGSIADAAGIPTAAAWSSTDARSWKTLKLGAPVRSLGSGIAVTPSGLLIVGASGGGGLVWTTVDGSTWTAQTVPNASLWDVTATAGGALVVGQAAPGPDGVPTVWTAAGPDVTTWVATPVGTKGQPSRIAVGPDGVLVVAGTVNDGTGSIQITVWRSVDGIDWTTVIPDGLAPGAESVAGLEWTPAGFVLAVYHGDQGKATGSIWLSPDGVTWQHTLQVPDGQVTAVTPLGTGVLAFGNGRTWRSDDGVTWVEHKEPGLHGNTVGAVTTLQDGRLLAIGRRTTVTPPAMAILTGTPADLPPAPSASPAPSTSPAPSASAAP